MSAKKTKTSSKKTKPAQVAGAQPAVALRRELKRDPSIPYVMNETERSLSRQMKITHEAYLESRAQTRGAPVVLPRDYPYGSAPDGPPKAIETAEERQQHGKALREDTVAVWIPAVPTEGQFHMADLAPVFNVSFRDRAGTSEAVGGLLGSLYFKRDVLPNDGTYWVPDVLDLGPGALLEVAAQLVESPDLGALANNTLSEITDRVALALRKAILLRHLQAAKWNLEHCADRLRFSDASAVRREIRRCGLEPEYEAAKATGALKPGGHKTRVKDQREQPKQAEEEAASTIERIATTAPKKQKTSR